MGERGFPPVQTIDIDGPVAFHELPGPSDTTFVLVHGLGGSAVNWIRVADGLAGLGRVVALDLPGFGRSPLAGRSAALMDQRRVLSRAIAQLGNGRVILCGNSLGGGLAILHAAVEPDSVAGLVLTGSVFPAVVRRPPNPLVMAAFGTYQVPGLGEAAIRARLRRMSPEQMVRLGFALCAARPEEIPAEVGLAHVEILRERATDPEATKAFIEASRSMMRLGRRPAVAARALAGVRCPVLVLHGRRDRLVPAAWAEAALAAHPEWRGRIFPDLGHIPQLEAPGRWLAETADWYAETYP